MGIFLNLSFPPKEILLSLLFIKGNLDIFKRVTSAGLCETPLLEHTALQNFPPPLFSALFCIDAVSPFLCPVSQPPPWVGLSHVSRGEKEQLEKETCWDCLMDAAEEREHKVGCSTPAPEHHWGWGASRSAARGMNTAKTICSPQGFGPRREFHKEWRHTPAAHNTHWACTGAGITRHITAPCDLQ